MQSLAWGLLIAFGLNFLAQLFLTDVELLDARSRTSTGKIRFASFFDFALILILCGRILGWW